MYSFQCFCLGGKEEGEMLHSDVYFRQYYPPSLPVRIVQYLICANKALWGDLLRTEIIQLIYSDILANTNYWPSSSNLAHIWPGDMCLHTDGDSQSTGTTEDHHFIVEKNREIPGEKWYCDTLFGFLLRICPGSIATRTQVMFPTHCHLQDNKHGVVTGNRRRRPSLLYCGGRFAVNFNLIGVFVLPRKGPVSVAVTTLSSGLAPLLGLFGILYCRPDKTCLKWHCHHYCLCVVTVRRSFHATVITPTPSVCCSPQKGFSLITPFPLISATATLYHSFNNAPSNTV